MTEEQINDLQKALTKAQANLEAHTKEVAQLRRQLRERPDGKFELFSKDLLRVIADHTSKPQPIPEVKADSHGDKDAFPNAVQIMVGEHLLQIESIHDGILTIATPLANDENEQFAILHLDWRACTGRVVYLPDGIKAGATTAKIENPRSRRQ